MPGFREFLEGVSPQSQPGSPFIKEFWERSFHCECPPTVCKGKAEHDDWHNKLGGYVKGCTTCGAASGRKPLPGLTLL